MKTSEILKAGKALIVDPENWTQRAYFLDAKGFMTVAGDRDILPNDAVCMCSLGALRVSSNVRFEGDTSGFTYLKIAAQVLNKNITGVRAITDNVDTYNDSHSHSEVMELWDKAIQLAEEDETKFVPACENANMSWRDNP